MNQVNRILIFGDSHISSRKRGFHIDYPKESMYYFKEQTKVAQEIQADAMIGLGDITYGNMDLSYRKVFEEELDKQIRITSGKRYELKGNHDFGKNITEYEFYNNSGRLKGTEHFNAELKEDLLAQGLHLTFLDYHKVLEYKHEHKPNCLNVVLVHGTLAFNSNEIIPPFITKGRVNMQDNPNWYGVDIIVCGHVHTPSANVGHVFSADRTSTYKTQLIYPGCPCRTAFSSSVTDEDGNITDEVNAIYRVILEKDSKGTWNCLIQSYDMLPLKDCIQLTTIENNKEREKILQLDDIVQKINNGSFEIVDYEDTIRNQSGIPIEIRKRAIELMQQARAVL